MRAGVRICRAAAGNSRVVASRPAAGSVVVPVEPTGAVAERAAPGAAAVHSRTEALANRAAGHVEAASQKIFRGSSDGTSYAADTPVLGQLFGPRPREPSAVSSSSSSRSTQAAPASSPVPAAPRSLAELETLPAAELRRMLAVRCVSLGSATEKAELANWVFQHQNLPVRRQDAEPEEAARRSPATQGFAAKSLAELRQTSTVELRGMLAERGVGEGSATEKGELVEWVWQHRNLPVLHDGAHRRERTGRSAFRPGFGAHTESYDVPRDKEQKRGPELLEGQDPTLRLEENAEQRLLEAGAGAAEEEVKKRPWWLWAVVGGTVGVAGAFGFLATNDARRAALEEQQRNQCSAPV